MEKPWQQLTVTEKMEALRADIVNDMFHLSGSVTNLEMFKDQTTQDLRLLRAEIAKLNARLDKAAAATAAGTERVAILSFQAPKPTSR